MVLEPTLDQRAVGIEEKFPFSFPLRTGSLIYARGTLSRNPGLLLDLVEAEFEDVSKVKDGLSGRLFHGFGLSFGGGS
jgi:hypothetical protein